MARQHIHPNSNGKFYRIHEDTNTSIYIYLGIEKPWFPIDVPLFSMCSTVQLPVPVL